METKQPNSALISRQVYDTTRKLLSNPADRAAVYEGILELTFSGSCADHSNPVVRTILEMIKPFVADDLQKYAARCERNKANATRSHSQPLAATRSDSQPLAANTNTNNNTNNNNNTISANAENTEERDKFICMLTLFKRGILNVKAEFEVFWNYYESLGWRNKNGSPVVRKASAAAMWRPQGETGKMSEGAEAWARILGAGTCLDTRAIIWFDSVNATPEELIIYLKCTPDEVQIFDRTFLPQVKALARCYEAKKVSYRIVRSPAQ